MSKKKGRHTLQIEDQAIPYAIKRGKPNRIRLSFDEDLRLCIETGNGRLGNKEMDFVLSKSNWILKGFRSISDEYRKRDALLSGLDRSIQLLGKQTRLQFVPAEKTYFGFDPPGPFRVHAPEQYIRTHKKKLLFYALQEYARWYLVPRVQYWSDICELDFNKLRVRDLKSKWGSCSSLRNISLNWQLIFLDEDLIDYVIVHELMHLREMNHSPRFWSWVGKYFPEYKNARKRIKEQQWLVGILK